MIKNLLFALSLVLALTSLDAQNKRDSFVVSGNILEKESQLSIEYATVAFFSTTENKIIGGGITDSEGNFSIEIPKGIYDISYEYF